MPLISTSIASGAYNITYVINSSVRDIGLTEGPIRLQQNINGIPVRSTQWGDAIIDYILRSGGAFGVLVIKEWTDYTKYFMWPFGRTSGSPGLGDFGAVPEAGVKFSDYCSQLVLTAEANTPAATLGPVTRTYPYVATLPGHNLDVPFVAGMRDIVCAVGVLPSPYTTGSRKARFFTDT